MRHALRLRLARFTAAHFALLVLVATFGVLAACAQSRVDPNMPSAQERGLNPGTTSPAALADAGAGNNTGDVTK